MGKLSSCASVRNSSYSSSFNCRPLQLTRLSVSLGLRLVPQQLPQNLAGRILRDGVDKLDAARQTLMPRNMPRHPVLDFLLGRRLAYIEHNISTRVLFIVKRDPDNGCISYGIVLEQDGFELCWGDLVAFDLDELLRFVVSGLTSRGGTAFLGILPSSYQQ
jgi:hypothetical protein